MGENRLPILDEIKKIIDGDKPEEKKKQAPLPELWGVTYVEPMPGGAHRNCKNCFMWVIGENKCLIHDKNLKVTGLMVCGYHVPGQPQRKWIEFPGLVPENPKYSGLNGEVPDGTACENCKFFESTGDETGVCYGTVKKNRPAPVHPKGCCSRWEQKEEEEG